MADKFSIRKNILSYLSETLLNKHHPGKFRENPWLFPILNQSYITNFVLDLIHLRKYNEVSDIIISYNKHYGKYPPTTSKLHYGAFFGDVTLLRLIRDNNTYLLHSVFPHLYERDSMEQTIRSTVFKMRVTEPWEQEEFCKNFYGLLKILPDREKNITRLLALTKTYLARSCLNSLVQLVREDYPLIFRKYISFKEDFVSEI
jgi:hypothetical protein